MKKVTFNLDETHIAELRKIAYEADRSLSAQLGRIIRNVLAGEEPLR